MRKNYFAKKFVAYSMAFAVAFSTLTVSPVFVKEAKAAVAVADDLGTNAVTTIDDGTVLISTLDSSNSTVGAHTTVSALKSDLGLNSGQEISKYTVKGTGPITDTATPDYAIYTATDADMYPSGALESDTTIKGILIDGKDNKNKKLTVTTAGGKWFKLIPYTGTYSVATGSDKANVTYTYFKATLVANMKDATVDDSAYTFNGATELASSDMGLYIYGPVDANGKLSSIEKFYNIAEKSDLKVKERKANTLVSLGSKAKLSVIATLSNNKTLTYTWTKDGKDLGVNTDSISFESVKKEDLGTYKCTVSDGIKEISVYPRLSLVTDSNMTTTVKNNIHQINTDINVLTSGGYIPGNKVTLTSSIPSGDYRYVWVDKADKKITLSQNDTLNYSASNNSITFESTADLRSKGVICYAVKASVYEKTLETALKTVKEATDDVSKYRANDTLRNAEIDVDGDGEILDALKGAAVYTERFSFGVSDSTNTSVVKNVKLGDSITLTAPTKLNTKTNTADAHQYQWTINDGATVVSTDKDFVIDTIDVNDLGKITCEVKECGQTHTGEEVCYDTAAGHATVKSLAKITYNMVYASDLAATASDVTAKENQEGVALNVTATGTLPTITYQWKTSTYTDGSWGTPVPTGNATTDKQATYKFTTPFNKANFFNGNVANSKMFICEVTDGIKTIEVPVKITEVNTFKVYEDKTKVEAAYEINATHYPTGITLAGLKDEKVTLAPVVVAASEQIEKELKYQWKKDGVDYSTDKEITVSYDKNTTYTLTITEGTNPVTVTYNLVIVTKDDLKKVVKGNVAVNAESNVIYTGKEINPVNFVKVSANLVGDATLETYTLKEGTDYIVKLTDAINAGVSLYDVELIGDFAELYKTFSEVDKKQPLTALKGTFTITRADNKVEIADNTVVLGKSVQPKTVTNLGKGALTYTYYADEAVTTEIAAPTKVGTYYVKATANATINYNEAESNVATVKVVPGKVKMLGTSRTASSVKLNWNKATGATSYRVYYKAAGAKSYKVFKNTTATSMNVTGLASATTYTFAVKAYAKTAGYSTVYATKQTTTAPAKVAKPTVTAGSKKATVKFDKVARATGYQIYMAEGNGSYKKVATTKNLSFTKTGLAKGATYKFKVRAYKTVGSNTYYGAFSSAKAVVVK